ncbi:MAG: metallophosphoesterase [Weeksellaceae bacterium]|nr:metallophosphoesterase [Weeksellaceae bacterium]
MWAFIKTFFIPLVVLVALVDFAFFRFLLRLTQGQGFGLYFIVILLAIEYYSYQAARILAPNKYVMYAYIAVHVILYGILFYMSYSRGSGWSSAHFKNMLILLTLFIVPKIFLAVAMVIEDAVRLIWYTYSNYRISDDVEIPSRRKAVAWIALGVAAIPFLGVVHGIFIGKYNYRVVRKPVYLDDLPEEFEGFTITQLSDIHAGSFDNDERVQYGIDLANRQNSDIIVFTGDMVNNVYTEVVPYTPFFAKLSAKEGMFAVLGNHDYGHYGNLTEEEKKFSKPRLQDEQRKMGFKPLNNEMHSIVRNGKRLNIVGVENWGNAPFFPKYGDLDIATSGVREGDINVLLSHDPSHFDHDLEEAPNVRDYTKKIHLTLSGHTHGMQFGVEIPGFIKWSPVKYRYHNWAGLYKDRDRYLYVNRGFGFLGFPGRVGIWPEVTVLELRKTTPGKTKRGANA